MPNAAQAVPLAIIEIIARAPPWGEIRDIVFAGKTSHALTLACWRQPTATRLTIVGRCLGRCQEYLEKSADYLDTLGFGDKSMHDMPRRMQTIAERKNDDPKEVV